MTATRQSGGRFAPGLSANPKGRPRGQSKTTGLRKELSDALPAVLQTVIQLAAMGDLMACRLILERTLPSMRPTDSTVMINLSGSLREQGEAVIAAIGAGQITPAVGSQLVGALAAQAKIIDSTELADRITRLEELNDDSTR